MSNNLLQAFINQTYGSISKAQEADGKANNREKLLNDFDQERMSKAMLQMASDQSISSKVSIPTKLKEGELNQKIIPHPNMQYDHSLTMDRKSALRTNFLNEKYKNNPQDRPTNFDFSEDWSNLDDDGDLPIL